MMLPRALIALFSLITPLLFAAESEGWRDVEGRSHQPFAPKPHKAAALLFLSCDCPISNVYAPEIARLMKEFSTVPFYLVYPDPAVTAAEVKKHAAEHKLAAPLLLDPQCELARKAGATITPEAVVVGAEGKVFYRGRINNRFQDLGRERNVTTQHDLREALRAVLAGKPVAVPETKAVGCFIPEPKKK